MRPQGLIPHPRGRRVSRVWDLLASRRPQGPRSSAFTPFPQVGPLGLLDLAIPTHLRLLNAPILVPDPTCRPPQASCKCPLLRPQGSGRLTRGAPTRPPPLEVARNLPAPSLSWLHPETPWARPLPRAQGLERPPFVSPCPPPGAGASGSRTGVDLEGTGRGTAFPLGSSRLVPEGGVGRRRLYTCAP